jgi:hypothetical protein
MIQKVCMEIENSMLFIIIILLIVNKSTNLFGEKYVVVDKIGGESFSGWKGFSQIRFNRYSEGQSMAKHNDHIHSIFDGQIKGIPVLSIVGVLNDDYQGGEFIMFDDYEIKFKAGDVLLFPSIFLYPHLVKPVTKGTRYSLVSWVF